MGYEQVQEINDLVYYVWDAVALVCFLNQDRPLRYTEVGTALDEWARRRPSDSDLTRLLNRLHDADLLKRAGARKRDHVYSLNSAGRKRANRIALLIQALHSDPPAP